MMCGLGTECTAKIAQCLSSQLSQTPLRWRETLVGLCNIWVSGPIKETRIGQTTAKRIAMTTDRFSQRIDHNTGADFFGAE